MPLVRVLTFNILLGGERREEGIAEVLKHSGADVVALQEVRDNGLVQHLAKSLDMTAVQAEPSDGAGLGLAVLSRLPVVEHHNRRHEGMLRSHLHLTLAPRRGAAFRLHVVHLAARFGERAKGEGRRLREVEAVLGDIAAEPAAPHLLVGDFNTLAPGDDLEATAFFRRMAALRRDGLLVRQADGWVGPGALDGEMSRLADGWRSHGIDPRLVPGVPVLPWIAGPLTSVLPPTRAVDRTLGRMIERWTVPRLARAGYVDCFRRLHPRAHGYTCPTWLPAARVDYIFASPDLAARVTSCEVAGGRGRWAREVLATASDHFPLVAELRD